MLKNQEFKAYGSIRKMKFGGACGVILALAMLGMAFSSTVTADEVNVNIPVAVEKKAEFEVAISHESLDKAMTEAKEAGVNVEIDDVQDEGVATSETVVSKQKEIEADYAKHESEVKQKTDEYKKAKTNNEAERRAVLAENESIERDNAKKKDDYKESLKAQEDYNKKVDKENTELKEQYDKKLENYNKELAAYNKQKEELAKKGVKAEKPNITVYGDYDNSKRGSVGYYSNLTALFEHVEGLIGVKDYIGLHSDTTISGSRADLFAKNDYYFAEIVNPKAGDSFTLHNVAETKDGQKLSAKFTFNSTEAEWVKNGRPLSDTRIYIRKDNGSGSVNFVFGNLVQFDTKINFFNEKTKKDAILALASTFNDIDYGQELRFTYQDGSEGIVLNPNGSEVKEVTRDGKAYYKGVYSSADRTYYLNVGDESDIPLGSILSVGYGSSVNFTYYNGVGVHSEEEIESKRAEVIRQNDGKQLADKDIFYQDGWAVGLFGKASSTVPVTILSKPPVEPEWKKKDTKEIKLVLRKPKDLPNKPAAPTVKIKYRRLRVNPSTPKPVKAITDNFGNNIDGANTFDKNVKFSLTTDYKPYSTFTADSKTYGKTWAMIDDVQDGAYTVDDNKIAMKDSSGKDVKDLFNMYHVLSEKERTQEIQNILKEAGLNPRGEFYMFVAKDSASFYKNYVRQAKNITIDLPAHLLVEKGQIVKNDFHQIDFGNGFVSNLVTVQVPNLKPEKHALDQKDNSKVRDGQEIQIGEYLRYLLDGVTVPAKHDTLYQYDGIDKLDVRHDRYTGNWSGIIRGTEYLAEKDLILPYDVVLTDGRVVKAGDKIVKGSAYAFKFEFDQSTNSDFIKKIIKVTWNEQDGKWSYTIDKEFLNSLGVQGTFDADFYIEVERIASGKVENTFVNIVNGQEMEAKVVTHTPEVPNSPELPKLPKSVKPTEPSKPVEPSKSVESIKQEQSEEFKELPNTGTNASSLGLIGTAILSVLGLAGLKRKKY